MSQENGRELPSQIYEGLAGFRLAMRRFLAFSGAALTEAEVTSQQYQAMLVIKTADNEQVSIKELAEQMLMQPHGAVQLVDRLAAAGFAERVPSTADRRSIFARLTPRGETVLEALAKAHVQELLNNESLLIESIKRLRQLGSGAATRS